MSPHTPELLVADSFRVRASSATGAPEVRGVEAHFSRFRLGVRDAWGGGARVGSLIDEFIETSRSSIADYGAGWPRLELWGQEHGHTPDSIPTDLQLRLSLRPLPELSESIELRTAGHVARPHPSRKGPNISRYAELNRSLGAEALFCDEHGYVLEGSSTSLVWWQGDTLCSAQAPCRVSSVTEMLVTKYAKSKAIHEARSALTAELLGQEVWALNALHGIRIVSSIDGVQLVPPNEDRLQEFRDVLDASWRPLK